MNTILLLLLTCLLVNCSSVEDKRSSFAGTDNQEKTAKSTKSECAKDKEEDQDTQMVEVLNESEEMKLAKAEGVGKFAEEIINIQNNSSELNIPVSSTIRDCRSKGAKKNACEKKYRLIRGKVSTPKEILIQKCTKAGTENTESEEIEYIARNWDQEPRFDNLLCDIFLKESDKLYLIHFATYTKDFCFKKLSKKIAEKRKTGFICVDSTPTEEYTF